MCYNTYMLQTLTILISGIVVGSATVFMIGLVIIKKTGRNSQDDQRKLDQMKMDLEGHFGKLSQEALKNANEQFLILAKEKLGSQAQESKTDLETKKQSIEKLISELRRELTENKADLFKSGEKTSASFFALKQELETYKKITGELKNSTDDLKKILSNNQLRGRFGEQVAENLLKMAGFVIGQDYQYNKEQKTEDTRPDFTVFLPDKTKINVDVKFPYQALQRMVETENQDEKKRYKVQFEQDVKKKIKQVTTRDYINPEEKTVDFVILFVPNEMIFSFIYDQMNDIWEDAMQKKVILAGPFSFTAILRMVKQAYSNFRYQKNLYQAIALIQKFEQEFQKFGDEFYKVGEKINSCQKQFNTVATTRANKLTKIVTQISSEEIGDTRQIDADVKQINTDDDEIV
ncbi:DNA recombination protein RmuC [bacterium]|nr:MAG: DNA recombination protein RmuC [bacterium]